jgi:GTP-binding protein
MSSLPIVAIVGRPNVGKSTLFNRMVGERAAIVEDTAGTTRDRVYGETDWNGRRFMMVDTGGLELEPGTSIEERVQDQARVAIDEADLVLFVVDAAAGLAPLDHEVADRLRKAHRPTILVINKADNVRREAEGAEFYALGFDPAITISAAHGRNTGDLADLIVEHLPPAPEAPEADAAPSVSDEEDLPTDAELEELAAADIGPPRVAIVGRPNTGKSTLVNRVLGKERMIVSETPGTTRDAVDAEVTVDGEPMVLIDTAGIRRRGSIRRGTEHYSVLRSLKAIDRADVAVVLTDAVEGFTAQDAHVAGYVVEEGRGLVIAVNKWDLVSEKTDRTFDQYTEWIRTEVPFIDFAPIVSISAKTGQRVGKVLELAIDIWGERRKRISTAELNRILRAATERQSPPPVKGRRPKIFYGTQAAVAPPTFVFFANDAGSVHFSYRRYIENRLRDEFGFDGTPIKLVFRDRESVKLPRRRSKPGPPPRRVAAASVRRPKR